MWEKPGLIVLVSSLFSSFSAQLIKLLFYLIRDRKFNLKILFSTGGMPSSHSAFVSCLSTSVALIEGLASLDFAICTVFSSIVMYDASGVRRSVGIQAGILNQMIEELIRDNKEFKFERIKELIGHTPFEVIVGAGFGSLIGFLSCLIFQL